MWRDALSRALGRACAALALVAVAPILAAAALGIRAASPGPILYRARRVGLRGRVFTMYKLRTMHVAAVDRPAGGPITGVADPRVYPFGAWLRRTKIDELPQLFNVLRGDMTWVGPRPEDPEMVARYYAPVHYLTLLARPGLTSPGSLFQYTMGDELLAGGDPEARYAARVLPRKLAIDLVYLARASVWEDSTVLWRTAVTVIAIAAGRRTFPPPPELEDPRFARAVARLGGLGTAA